MIGRQFGELVVLKSAGTLNGHKMWLCSCVCGSQTNKRGSHLLTGAVQSCGCRQREKFLGCRLRHGHRRKDVTSREYISWLGMRNRCTNPKNNRYALYAGRGITVCNAWLNSFDQFLADMGPKPTPQHSIDRIDNNGNYEPGNCRWATRSEQMRNRSDFETKARKLSDAQVEAIKRDPRQAKLIAAELKMDTSHIYKIRNGKARNHSTKSETAHGRT